jgi:hypothetical protein
VIKLTIWGQGKVSLAAPWSPWKLKVLLYKGPQQTEMQKEIYKGNGGPKVKFYLSYVLGSGLLCHSPGTIEANVFFSVDHLPLGGSYYFVLFSSGSCLWNLCS